MKKLGQRLATLLKLKGISQVALAQRAQMHPTNLNKFLNGETDIRVSSLEKILAAVDLSVASLIDQELNRQLGFEMEIRDFGRALELLIKELDPIYADTILGSLLVKHKGSSNKNLLSAINIIKGNKEGLRKKRRDKWM